MNKKVNGTNTKTTSLHLRLEMQFKLDIDELAAYRGLPATTYAYSVLFQAIRAEMCAYRASTENLLIAPIGARKGKINLGKASGKSNGKVAHTRKTG